MGKNPEERTRILVVDDDTGLRDMLIDLLNARGYMASGTSNPHDAEDAVAIWGAQVVLLDIMMPGLSGLEITRRLKAKDPGTQIILMTGYPSVESVDAAHALGADGYLLKPFDSIELVIDTIEKATESIHSWHTQIREALQQEFPEEYHLIYETPPELPGPDEMQRLIAQFETDSAAS